ncbi:hypothetical protein BRC19_00290 [Candidatus Saccharibacteria bacterium QS_5_54_17]|nr:MAG: hypothetical protein BRC19_00290 [Candidatus Saccharibacteria bacterium QS_5_54_17]
MLSLTDAKTAAQAATEKADELGIKITVSVVDEHGVATLTERMDGALHISPEFATTKAYTSAVLGLSTQDIGQYSGEGGPFYGVSSAFGGKIMVIAGGIPVKRNGEVIGGIGVGGSYDVNQDVECATAAVSAIS